jgi:membrane protein DedA with SNARE-associated domain
MGSLSRGCFFAIKKIVLGQVGSLITSFILGLGYPAIFLLMTLESALVPIPSEVTMPFAGFLVAQGKLSFLAVVLVGAFGNLAGSLVAYAVGFVSQEAIVRNLIRKYGRWLLVSEKEFETAKTWFVRYGSQIAFFSRLLPVVRTYISLPAGIAKMNVTKFSLFTFAGSVLWSAVLAYLGLILGQNWSSLEVYFRKFEVLILLALIILVIFYIHHKTKKELTVYKKCRTSMC